MGNKIKGGLSEGMSLKDIADKHKVSMDIINKQLSSGMKVEMEHTSSKAIAREIAMDHLSEDPYYYKKLKKYVEGRLFSFNEFMVLGESALEDIAPDGDDAHDLELLHELEYKLHKIVNNKWGVHPKLFKNIVIRFATTALEIYNEVAPKFDATFEWWRENHRIDSAEDFADMVEAEYEQSGEGFENIQTVSRGNLKITADDVVESISKETIYSQLKDWQYGGDDIVESFGWASEGYLEHKGIEIPDDADDNEEYAKQYINDNDMEDDFMDYLSETYSFMNLFGEVGAITADMWKDAIKTKLYPMYMDNYGSAVASVHEEIDEHFDRSAEIDENAISNKIDEFRVISSDSDALEDGAKEVYSECVAPLLRTISLAMNIDHVNGNISKDYGDYGGIDVHHTFYDDMDSLDVSSWDAELKRIIKG